MRRKPKKEDNRLAHATGGSVHMWNYLQYLEKTHKFKDAVNKLRKKYKITPRKLAEGGDSLPTAEWRAVNDNTKEERLYGDARKLCAEFLLDPDAFEITIMQYVFLMYLRPTRGDRGSDLCCLYDCVRDELADHRSWEKPDRKVKDKIHPIAIRISPYASENDIIDFVTSHYKKSIEPLQNEYRIDSVAIGKLRTKSHKREEIKRRVLELRQEGKQYKTIYKQIRAEYPDESKKGGILDGVDESTLGKWVSRERRIGQ